MRSSNENKSDRITLYSSSPGLAKRGDGLLPILEVINELLTCAQSDVRFDLHFKFIDGEVGSQTLYHQTLAYVISFIIFGGTGFLLSHSPFLFMFRTALTRLDTNDTYVMNYLTNLVSHKSVVDIFITDHDFINDWTILLK